MEPQKEPEAPDAVLDPERHWLEKVYQPGARQLTVRAVLSGMVIGAVMCLANLYIVLKTGWSMGVTVTATILAFGLFQVLRSIGLTRKTFSMLENNAMGSVASAAGYMTGGGNMAAVPALLMLTGTRPGTVALILWFGSIAILGVFAAIPIKRQLINIEQLPFPTGMATAETIRSMHAAEAHDGGAEEAGKQAKGKGENKAQVLAIAGVVGAIIAFLKDAKAAWMPFNLPASYPFPLKWGGFAAKDWTLGVDGGSILLAAGALMGFRTGWSLLLGAIGTYGFLAPAMVERHVIAEVKYKVMVQWTLWPGAAILLASGLLSFAFEYKSVVRSFSGLFGSGRKPGARGPESAYRKSDEASPAADPLANIESPMWWFPAAFALVGPVVVLLMWVLFGIPWWAGLVALPLSVLMGVVAARVTGETDVTPTKALGPVTQLTYGAMLPGNVPASVMGANVTGGVGLHAADLLTDLKSGYLLGANPRQQVYAQLFGVPIGAVSVVLAFNLLVPDASVLGSEQFPAPAVQVWAGVSKALTAGFSSLHPTAKIATLIGLGIGAVLALLDRFVPKRFKAYIPAASGLGIAMVVPGTNAVAMFLGAALAEALRRYNKPLADRTVVPVSSGLIAGESLMGILVAVLVAVGVLSK